MFKNLRIRTQILISFLVVVVLTIVILMFSLLNINSSAVAASTLYTNIIEPLDKLSQARTLMESVKTDGRTVFIIGDAQARSEVVQKIIEEVTLAKEHINVFRQTIQRLEAYRPAEDLVAALDDYLLKTDRYSELVLMDLNDPVNYNGLLNYLDNTLSPISTQCIEYMKTLNQIRLSLGAELIDGVTGSVNGTIQVMIILFVISALVTLAFGAFISAYLSKPILKGVDIMGRAAEGDFTVTLPTDYGAEIGKLFGACNSLLNYNRVNIITISETSQLLRESASKLLDISTTMADNSNGLNDQTARVSATIEEFSAAMIESTGALSTASEHIGAVASSIDTINTNIASVAMASEETSTRVEQSSQLVDNIKNSITMASGSTTLVSNTFNNVAESVDEINKSIIKINEDCVSAMRRVSDADVKAKNADAIIRQLEIAGKQISKVIGIINDIADQTNMLALNAAIEAAGAGEAGKGFMVVANEVKDLARQTADATDEVAEQIENMQKNMPVAVNAVIEIVENMNGLSDFMKELLEEVSRQRKRSDKIAEESASSARRMNEISVEIGRISDNALSVTKTVMDSAKGVVEIAKSTNELVVGTNEIAMNSERVANNINAIDATAKEMNDGLAAISQNIQIIHLESSSVQQNAGNANRASEEMLEIAREMENIVASFKLK